MTNHRTPHRRTRRTARRHTRPRSPICQQAIRSARLRRGTGSKPMSSRPEAPTAPAPTGCTSKWSTRPMATNRTPATSSSARTSTPHPARRGRRRRTGGTRRSSRWRRSCAGSTRRSPGPSIKLFGRVLFVELEADSVAQIEEGQLPAARFRGQYRIEQDFGKYDFARRRPLGSPVGVARRFPAR